MKYSEIFVLFFIFELKTNKNKKNTIVVAQTICPLGKLFPNELVTFIISLLISYGLGLAKNIFKI